MKKSIIAVSILLSTFGAQAQVPNLDDQIGAVGAAVDAHNAQLALIQAQQQAAYQAQLAEAARRQRIADHLALKEQAADQARLDRLAAAKAAREAKNESYADEQRDLDLQSRKLDLQAKAVDVSRENDVISSGIAREKAKTDVIQSNADVNRNISSGIKSNLEDSGKAEVKKASSIW
jgi:hypothetical protein